MYTAFIHDGPVLMAINIGEAATKDQPEAQLTQAEVDAIITAAAARLP